MGTCASAKVWARADASLCDHCLAPDVVMNQPVLGRVYKGLDMIKDLVQNHYAKARSLIAADCCSCGKCLELTRNIPREPCLSTRSAIQHVYACDKFCAPHAAMSWNAASPIQLWCAHEHTADVVAVATSQNWGAKENTMRFSATAGSTAFHWWCSKGVERQAGVEVRDDTLAKTGSGKSGCVEGKRKRQCQMLRTSEMVCCQDAPSRRGQVPAVMEHPSPTRLRQGCLALLPCACIALIEAATQSTMFGLEVMKVNADVKIDRIIGFRQLTRHELDEYVKPEFRQLV